MLPVAAEVGYLKTTSVFSQLSKDITLLQSATLLQIYTWFEADHVRDLPKCGLEVCLFLFVFWQRPFFLW